MKFMRGRHVLIPWLRSEDIATAAEVCQSFCVDCSAYTAWKQGNPINDWLAYYEFVDLWRRHPAFDFALPPDVIDGSEEENDRLLDEFAMRFGLTVGAPVWHMHESLSRLDRLCTDYPRIALGSSGQFSSVGTHKWWNRIEQAMDVICDPDGRPRSKAHGLRMLDPEIFKRLPLSSADSTNAVRNSSSFARFGMYISPNASTRMVTIAERIEAYQSAPLWIRSNQLSLWLDDDECFVTPQPLETGEAK